MQKSYKRENKNKNFEIIENKNNQEMYLEHLIEYAISNDCVKIYFDGKRQKTNSGTNENLYT